MAVPLSYLPKPTIPEAIIHNANVLDGLATLPDGMFNCCVTSPPYWGLRDYGEEEQIGLERTPEEYVERLVGVFGEVWRVLRDDGTLWLNLGDSYNNFRSEMGPGQSVHARRLNGKPGIKTKTRGAAGLKEKDLCGIPWLLAFALRADGWYLRQDIIWHKPNPMPESVRDRCTKAHEYLFLLSKSQKYWFDTEAMQEPATGRDPANLVALGPHETRNRRDVWTVATKPYKGAHFATFPPALIEPCILAGAPVDGWVLDPFVGSGTTCEVARKHGRNSFGIELKAEYCVLAEERLRRAEP